MEEDSSINVNVTESWHKYLLAQIMKIEEYERIARDGSNSIEGMFEISRSEIPIIQFDYLRQIITELDMLRSNTNKKLSDDFKKKSEKELNSAKELVDKHKDEILRMNFDQVSQRRIYEVTNKYWTILKVLQQLREEFVLELNDILYGQIGDTKKKW